MQYRTEWKYICDDCHLLQIESKVCRVLQPDIHSKNNKYIIHSLYFDNLTNDCMFDNDAGLSKRFKYRIRYYDNDKDYIVLEKKEKLNSLGRKLNCRLSKEQFDDIISNNISKVFWQSKNEILKKFCIDVQTKMFKPKIIIDYERTAYVEPITNIRITFDKNISCSNEINEFLNGNYTKRPLLEKDKHILEVKFDEILPSYIRKTVQNESLNQVSFSKYYLSRNTIERN